MFRLKLSKYKYRQLCEYINGRDQYCVNCGNPNNPSMSHVIRRSQGGDDSPNNIVKHCVMRPDGSEGCHHRFERGEIELNESVVEMLKGEPWKL